MDMHSLSMRIDPVRKRQRIIWTVVKLTGTPFQFNSPENNNSSNSSSREIKMIMVDQVIDAVVEVEVRLEKVDHLSNTPVVAIHLHEAVVAVVDGIRDEEGHAHHSPAAAVVEMGMAMVEVEILETIDHHGVITAAAVVVITDHVVDHLDHAPLLKGEDLVVLLVVDTTTDVVLLPVEEAPLVDGVHLVEEEGRLLHLEDGVLALILHALDPPVLILLIQGLLDRGQGRIQAHLVEEVRV